MVGDRAEGVRSLHARRGSLQERGQTDGVKDEMVRLGTEYGLCSAHTSFVAIEKRDTPVTGETQLRRVPIGLPSGWGGVDLATVTMASAPLVAVGFGAVLLGSALRRPGGAGPCDVRASGLLSAR